MGLKTRKSCTDIFVTTRFPGTEADDHDLRTPTPVEIRESVQLPGPSET